MLSGVHISIIVACVSLVVIRIRAPSAVLEFVVMELQRQRYSRQPGDYRRFVYFFADVIVLDKPTTAFVLFCVVSIVVFVAIKVNLHPHSH